MRRLSLSNQPEHIHGHMCSQFSELELQGWQDRAAAYEAIMHKMTDSTVPDLIAAVGDADAG